MKKEHIDKLRYMIEKKISGVEWVITNVPKSEKQLMSLGASLSLYKEILEEITKLSEQVMTNEPHNNDENIER